MTNYTRAIRGRAPWGRSEREVLDYPPAPRQLAPYVCQRRGCAFTIPLHANATPPPTWDCRCGGTADYAGTIPAAPERTPAPAPQRARVEDDPGHHLAWVRERRPLPDLDRLLAESIEARRADPFGGAS